MQQKLSLGLSLWRPALHRALWIHLSILGASCASTEKAPEAKPLETHFVLERGAVEKGDDPLPDLTPIYIRIYAGEQMVERRLGYRAWDFNKDGNCDMLETLNAQGQVLRRSYDMDHDGMIDMEQGPN